LSRKLCEFRCEAVSVLEEESLRQTVFDLDTEFLDSFDHPEQLFLSLSGNTMLYFVGEGSFFIVKLVLGDIHWE
jgi:hypothetical protein